jgi:hypothetical protein|tara:strand:+ start:164 stop:703 length:540 start_codon:yes stop_codon:yes gene_type:complete
MSKILVDTIDTRSGTTNLTIGSSNASQITLKSGATLTNFPDNTPAFHVTRNATQSIADDTDTVIQFDNEVIDTDNKFDLGGTHRFTPTVAGKYFLYACGMMYASANMQMHIRKNGTKIFGFRDRGGANTTDQSLYTGGIVEANTTDYFDVIFKQNSNGAINLQGEAFATFFGGYRIIGA